MPLLLILGSLGFAYGAVLQRSGFCFAKVGYELFLLGRRDAFNGVLAGLATATLGFGAISALRAHPQDHLLLLQIGPGTVIGAALFGIGMTVAGMCAAGTLLRIGEGYVVAWITLAGFILGAALDPFRAFLPKAWHTPYQAVWLASRFGLAGASLLTLALLALVWALLNGKLSRRVHVDAAGEAEEAKRPLILAPVAGGIALGLLSTLQAAVKEPWTVAGPLALAPRAISGTVTHAALVGMLPLLVVNLGLVLGAGACCAGRDKKWRLRWPRRREQIASSLLGGVLMGWGVMLARGCAIGGAFSAIPSLSLSGWLFLPSLIVGMWLGAQAVKRIG